VKKLFVASLLLLLSGCALLPHKVEVLQWPVDIPSLQGEGDLDVAWRKERFSGPFVIKMTYPDLLDLEVFGPFGQTLLYVKKEGDRFLLASGEEQTSDEALFEKRYGFSTRELMDDLAMRGQRRETAEGQVVERGRYRVLYGQDRHGRRKICWEGREGSICLSFNEVGFAGS
jgi:outer membrane biogenesis lipoprotein LolB